MIIMDTSYLQSKDSRPISTSWGTQNCQPQNPSSIRLKNEQQSFEID